MTSLTDWSFVSATCLMRRHRDGRRAIPLACLRSLAILEVTLQLCASQYKPPLQEFARAGAIFSPDGRDAGLRKVDSHKTICALIDSLYVVYAGGTERKEGERARLSLFSWLGPADYWPLYPVCPDSRPWALWAPFQEREANRKAGMNRLVDRPLYRGTTSSVWTAATPSRSAVHATPHISVRLSADSPYPW